MTNKEIKATLNEIENQKSENNALYYLGVRECSHWKYFMEMLNGQRDEVLTLITM